MVSDTVIGNLVNIKSRINQLSSLSPPHCYGGWKVFELFPKWPASSFCSSDLSFAEQGTHSFLARLRCPSFCLLIFPQQQLCAGNNLPVSGPPAVNLWVQCWALLSPSRCLGRSIYHMLQWPSRATTSRVCIGVSRASSSSPQGPGLPDIFPGIPDTLLPSPLRVPPLRLPSSGAVLPNHLCPGGHLRCAPSSLNLRVLCLTRNHPFLHLSISLVPPAPF